MKKQTKAVWQTVIIAALGVVIGFLGELMPDEIKDRVETFTTHTFGMSYLKIWIIMVGLVVIVFLIVVWKEALSNNPSNENASSNSPKVVQYGDKSVFIEKNKGDINIR